MHSFPASQVSRRHHFSSSSSLLSMSMPQNSSLVVEVPSIRSWMYSRPTNPALFTRISSFPNRVFKKSASRAMLGASVMSSWWKTTLESPRPLSFPTAAAPLASSLAVKTTTTARPLVEAAASCRQTSNPIPLFPPVTTAILVLEESGMEPSMHCMRLSWAGARVGTWEGLGR